MVKADEKFGRADWVDLFHFITYLEDHYGCSVELHFARNEDDPRNALLCITVVGNCKRHRTPVTYDYASCEIAYNSLSRVSSVAIELFYELLERLDGGCSWCQAEQATVR